MNYIIFHYRVEALVALTIRDFDMETKTTAWLIVTLCVGMALTSPGCGGEQEERSQPKPQVIFHDPPKPRDEKVDWIASISSWPDTLFITLDSNNEMYRDDLMLRFVFFAQQMFTGGEDADERPLWTQVQMTMRPVPDWSHAMGLVFDSIVYFDPIRSITLQSLLMLSSRRHYDGWTVRTQFGSNAVVRFTPDLTDGQLLEPTAYLTWDQRTLIVTGRPVNVEFVTELEYRPEPEPDWNPDSIPDIKDVSGTTP